MISILQLIGVLIVVCTALPISTSKRWWVRVWDFPRVQIACVAFFWLLISALSGVAKQNPTSILWILVLVCFAYQLWWVWPYLRRHNLEVLSCEQNGNAPSISILTSNVLMDNRNTAPLLELIEERDPDIVATLETDQWWQDALDKQIAYPYRLASALDNKYGMHLYSKLPFEHAEVEFLVEENIPSMNVMFLLEGSPVRLHVVHPTPPVPNENIQSTERDVELLILAKHLEDVQGPIIVTGDLNDVAWSKTTRLFRRISGLLDPRVGRGMFNSFHVNFFFIRWPLDHFFLSSHWRIKSIERLRDIGSDHFPVFVEISLQKPAILDTHLQKDQADTDLERETLQSDTANNSTSPSTPQQPD